MLDCTIVICFLASFKKKSNCCFITKNYLIVRFIITNSKNSNFEYPWSSCKNVFYCDKNCKKADLLNHKNNWENLSNKLPNIIDPLQIEIHSWAEN